jgi:RimJ/RimL family protein N-acetyltransferase
METTRLIMRRWKGGDLDDLAALNADPRVMEFLPSTLTRDQSQKLLEWLEIRFEAQGFGLWALELKATGELVGWTGLNAPKFEAPFMPCVEVGWRLAHRFWGSGLATEAACASIAYAFGPLKLKEIVSFTTRNNARSRAVMTRLGMTYDPNDDFEHPSLPAGNALRSHVLYRLSASG